MSALEPVSLHPAVDPWDPESSRRTGAHRLTSVEVTVTNRCNMRCRHCAVGETLTGDDPPRLPLPLLLSKLDEVRDLRTLSITGGEPSFSTQTMAGYVLPLLRYARERGLATQLNTNLTLELGRYELVAPWVDVLHITWNYTSVADFHRIAWGRAPAAAPSVTVSAALYERIIDNARALAAAGVFVSAESMVNRETAPCLGEMNRFIAAMGCRRHEVHPMYPVDWAADLDGLLLGKDEFRAAISRLMDERAPSLWVLLGTFPFLPCSPDPADQALLRRIRQAPGVSIRNCPDGRNRLNVNAFTGEILVTDFADIPPLGNLRAESLEDAFARLHAGDVLKPYLCYCPEAGCTGPNPIVAAMYHPGVDFRSRRARSE